MLRLSTPAKDFTKTYERTLPHALLLAGKNGVGLATFAKHIAGSSGKILHIITPQQKTSTSVPAINVDQVRSLYTSTRTYFGSPHFVIIDNADTMNHVAQNALLKLLEEPNESIHFILTSHKPDTLLPTIRSRVQRFDVPTISELESKKLITALGVTDDMDSKRLLFIASGLPAELTRLSTDKKAFSELIEHVSTARKFVEGTTYQRMIIIQSLKDDRMKALKLIELILLLLRRSLSPDSQVKSLTLISKLVTASEAVRANGNIRLQLLAAVV